jgi:hypothetical protein
MIEFNEAGLNNELKQRLAWMLCRLEDVRDPETGKIREDCKVPYQVVTGHMASHSNKGHWVFADECLKAHRAGRELHAGPNTVKVHDRRGVGCVLTPPYVGIDLDDCRNPETGELTAFAQEFLAKFPATFSEISMSGTGLHLWYHSAELKLEKGTKTKLGEVYQHSRYLWMTGNLLEGTPNEIERVAASQVKEMISFIVERSKKETAILDARKEPSRNSEDQKFAMLERGEWEPLQIGDKSHSAARWYFLVLLAKRYNFDAQVVDQKFRASGMYRGDKERLLDSEIAGAIEAARQEKPRSNSEAVYSLDEFSGEDIERTKKEYFWEPVLPLGALTHFGGPQGGGKSPVVIDLAARVTGGYDFPCGGKNPWGSKRVLLFSVEDDAGDTTMPRFDLAHGLPFLLHVIKGVKIQKGESFSKAMFALDRDIRLISKRAREIEALGLIIFDPITNYLGKLSFTKEDEVRTALTPLATLAQDLKISVITIGHFNRRTESLDPLMRMMGAAAFTGVARAVWSFGPDGASPYAHIMAPVRGPVGEESFKFHTEEVTAYINGVEETKVIKVVWDGRSKATGEDTVTPVTRKEKNKTREAADALHQYLLGGKRAATECKEFMKVGGYDLDKLNSTDVCDLAGVKKEQKDRKWWWFLPTSADLFEPSPLRQKRVEELSKDDAPSY